jgi:mono/diheme cytochrome c family protein
VSSLRVLFLLAFAVGCERAPPRRAVADVPPAPAPLLRLEGLAPWSNPWILAHTESYLDDPAARRAAMEGSLTQPSNLYSEARLTHYGRGTRGWDTLPEWNPRVLPFDRARAEAFARGDRIEVSAPAFFDGSRPTDWQAWVALGRRVFHELPLRSEPYWADALRDRALAERLGVERAPDGSVPGLVLMRDLDGASRVGITCALCHAAPLVAGRAFVDGRARRALDYGLARVALARSRGRPLSDEAEARFSGWGRGRADVLEELSEVPIAIPDLYGLRALRWLTQGATLRHVSPLALAVRQETQYVQANHLRTRPPRVLVWALVAFLYALEPPPASAPSPDATTLARGRVLFEAHCRGCHDGPAWSGDPTSLARIETDPELARGRARGTGAYRPAPLLRVRDAAPYLHHGVVPDLASLLSPSREEPGHRFGTDLDETDRAALVAFLETL